MIGALIIGDEITRGRRQDKHITKTIELLAARGIKDYDSAKLFFRPDLSHLHDPFLMKGMKEAVARITDAVEWHEKILVYGDYDVDGTTAVATMYSFLRSQYKGQLAYYIPHREREGYGVSKAGIDYAHAHAYTLMITLDCGIKSTELVKYAAKVAQFPAPALVRSLL